MLYREAIDYLYRQLPMFQRIGPAAFKKDLKNIEQLATWLDEPQRRFKSIHIAGTNGKGSTTHLIGAILQAQGYKVGIYSSPHYRDFRERIKINGQLIDKNYVRSFVEWYRSVSSEIEASFFELTVAMAFDYFAKEQVDVAIVETGLGGRLDSTNIVRPELSVITNISYDHMNFLGNTLELIAAEKGGIIKSQIPVIIGRKQNETHDVFQRLAIERLSPMHYAEDLIAYQSNDDGDLVFKVNETNEETKVVWHQAPFFAENVRTALSAAYVLNESGAFSIKYQEAGSAIDRVAELTHFIGRWVKLQENPLVLADSAHNLDGLRQVIDQLNQMGKEDMHFVLGFVFDKDLSDVLSLFPKSAHYYFAKADIPRGMPIDQLVPLGAQFGLFGKGYSSIRKALAAAKSRAQAEDLIYVGGSIFTVAEVI